MKSAVLRVETQIHEMLFARPLCFQGGMGETERRCLNALVTWLAKQPKPLVFYGAGALCRLILEHSRRARSLVKVIVDDAPVLQGEDLFGVPSRAPGSEIAAAGTVFLCAARWLTLHRMRKRLPDAVKSVTLDVLAQIDPGIVPKHAWMPRLNSIYPVDIPEVEIRSGLDMVLLDVPARYIAEMPVGLCYVHNALEKANVRHQTLDFGLILYHRYHTQRILDGVREITTENGYRLPDDPWETLNFEEWLKPGFLEYFQPDIDDLVAKLVAAGPKIVGLSIQQINRVVARRIVEGVRNGLPDAVILVGGMACADARVAWHVFTEADYMCVGEADLTVGPLVEALARGERPRDLPGVLSRYDSADRVWEDGPVPTNLDALEPPRYDWCDIQLYRTWNDDTVVPLVASRGCHWGRCRFCNEPYRFRGRSADNVLKEIQWFCDRGFRRFVFHDSDCNGDPEGLMVLCRKIRQRGLQIAISGQMRIRKTGTPEFFRTLREGGFHFIRFGVDGWSDNALRIQRKGYNKRIITENLRNCSRAGICTHVNCVIGVPGETEEDVDEAIRFMIENKPYYHQLAYCHSLMLLVGSEFWENPEAYKIRFRSDREQLYKETLIIPDEEWYSEDPHIDREVRKDRLLRILHALRDEGVNIGDYVHYIEDAVKKRGAFAAWREQAPDCGQESPVVVGTHGDYVLVRHLDRLYAYPDSMGSIDLTVPENRRLSGIVTGESEAQVRTIIDMIGAGPSETQEEARYCLFRQNEKVYGLPMDEGHLNVTDCTFDHTGGGLIRLLGSHRGYNILQYGNSFYGLPIALGHIDIRSKTDRSKPGIFAAETPEQVVTVINQISPTETSPQPAAPAQADDSAMEPIIVEENYKGFMVFVHLNQFCALARELCDVDLSRVTPEELRDYAKRGRFFMASSLAEIREKISAWNSENMATRPASPKGKAVLICCSPVERVRQYLAKLGDYDLTLLIPPSQEGRYPGYMTMTHRDRNGEGSESFDSVGVFSEELAQLKAQQFGTAFIAYDNRMIWRTGRLPERLAAAFAGRIVLLFADGDRRVYEGDEDLNRIAYNRAYMDNMLKLVPDLRGKTVLEVGCSDGLACDLLLREGAGRVMGIDVCDNVGCNYPGERIAYARMSADALAFPDNTFDLAFSIAVLEHCPTPRAVLEEMWRVTRPGGTIYVQTAPLYYSPFGHHMFGYFDDIPWIHLRRSPEQIIAHARAGGLEGRILRDRGQDAATYVRSMLSREHLNGKTLSEYGLPEFAEYHNLEVPHFHKSVEGEDILTEDIRRELEHIDPDDLITHGIEAVFRKGVAAEPSRHTEDFAALVA